jgi:hypothetical protein
MGMEACDICAGQLGFLGQLGWTEWYVCRDCGYERGYVTRYAVDKRRQRMEEDRHDYENGRG